MNEADRRRLEEAALLLENPGLVAKLADRVGQPINWAMKQLPGSASAMIRSATESAIRKALSVAVSTINRKRHVEPSRWSHRFAVAATGGAAGLFGLPALAIELPVSTVLMLRSIADIARSEGEDLDSLDARLACLEVFALGGSREVRDAAESGYYAVRIALTRALAEAGEFIAERGLVEEGAPVVLRLVARIAARFGVVVSEKTAAQAVPVVGAAGGAAINVLFMNHFQAMARGHFIVRSLERKWGAETVRTEYEKIAARI